MRYIYVIILVCGLSWLTGCKKDVTPEEVPAGIKFNPIKPYQEALPGSIITFKVAAKVPEVVTSFGVRFLFPGTTTYVSLPQYPDRVSTSGFTSSYLDFEYALPPSAVAINSDMKFKFIAVTESKTYEEIYTVRMKTTGFQALRLYNPVSASYFKFAALDLLNSAGVPESEPSLTKDIIAHTVNLSYEGKDYPLLAGFTSGNGTKFRAASAAQYTAAPPYLTAYNSISNSVEYATLSTAVAAPVPSVPVGSGMGVLAGNTYYIAKVPRGTTPITYSYVAIKIVKAPSATLLVSGSTPVQLPGSDVLDIEIKK